jgi:hypothetical protein
MLQPPTPVPMIKPPGVVAVILCREAASTLLRPIYLTNEHPMSIAGIEYDGCPAARALVLAIAGICLFALDVGWLWAYAAPGSAWLESVEEDNGSHGGPGVV